MKNAKTPKTRTPAAAYRIYGIFDFKKNTLLSVSLDLDTLRMEYDLGNYNSKKVNIISFELRFD